MLIELIYYPIHFHLYDQHSFHKKIIIDKDSSMEDILNMLNAKGLAKWKDDKWGGRVVENYKSKGKLVNNEKYFILSKNIKRTIAALKIL